MGLGKMNHAWSGAAQLSVSSLDAPAESLALGTADSQMWFERTQSAQSLQPWFARVKENTLDGSD